MAKVTFSKLKLVKKNEINTIQINGVDIEVKQYLPVEDKLGIIERVLQNSADANNFANPIKMEVFLYLEIMYNYTNINFTEAQKKEPVKLYDLLEENHIFTEVISAIPEDEYNYLVDSTDEIIKQYYKYRNSAYGIMENITKDYKDLDFDATEIQKKIGNKENVEFLQEVMEKLG
jgi:hypothetical protein